MDKTPFVAAVCGKLMAGVAAAGFATTAVASYNLASPFVWAQAGVYDGVGNPIGPDVNGANSAGPVVVEAGGAPAAYGKFRGALGSNGFEAFGAGGINREVDGGSIWSDGFTVAGGSGLGTLTVTTRITGSISGTGQMEYALFASSAPYDLDSVFASASANHSGFWTLTLPNSTRAMFTGVANGCGTGLSNKECGHTPYQNYSGALDIVLTANLPFTYGQPVYLVSVFVGAVLTPGGSASFFNSANFGISAPTGATIAATSGMPYAAAVPEPAVWLLLLLGLAALALKGSSRSSQASQASQACQACQA